MLKRKAPTGTALNRPREFSERLILAIVLFFSAMLLSIAIANSPEVSHVDELQHFDYMEKVSRGELVRRGDRVGRVAMREEACRGIDVSPAQFRALYGHAMNFPACDSEVMLPEGFPEQGQNTAFVHPPTYYAITGVLARGVQALTPIGSLLTAGRVVGILWLWAAVCLAWRLLAAFGIPFGIRTVVTLLLTSSTAVLSLFVTVNPDATALPAGAGLLLATTEWERGRVRIWVPMLVAAGGIALKATNVIGLMVAILYVAIRSIDSLRAGDREQANRLRRLPVSLVIVAVGIGALWLGVTAATARVPSASVYQLQRSRTETIPFEKIMSQGESGLLLAINDRPPPFAVSNLGRLTQAIFNAFLLVACVAACALARGKARSVALASLLAVATAGPVLVIANFCLSKIYVPIPGRYSMSAIAGLVVGAAFLLRPRLVTNAAVVLIVFQTMAFFQGLIVS